MCKGREALRYVQDRALELLDLRYEANDIEGIADEGIEALARGDSEGVMETLDLFVEMLEYESVPAEVLVNDYVMFGACHKAQNGRESFGPIIMYNDRTNTLRLIKQKVPVDDRIEIDVIPRVALGEQEPGAEGYEAIRFLKNEVLKKERPTVH
jgi:hypothetical protein